MSEPFETGAPRPDATGTQADNPTTTIKREGAAILDEARNRAEGLAAEGARTGADQAGGLARAIHRAAEELAPQSPGLARTIHDAAGSIEGMAERLRGSSPGEMLRGAEDFARRQPLAFFGAAALAGFAVARFAKSSAERRDRREHLGRPRERMAGNTAGMSDPATHTGDVPLPDTPSAGMSPGTATDTSIGAPGWVREADGPPRPATLASATLGGAAAHAPREAGKT